jgi:Arc/MetJ-type ribon-helix-helix transcriptional regulator
MAAKARVFGFGLGDKDCLKWLEDEVGTLGDDIKGVFDKLGDKFKVVCVSPDLKDSVDEMAKSQRDHVVMVRVDEETSRKLDAWVEAGAVKSRSEAAALFIREGLKVRQAELDKLEESLRDLEKARERVREKAREVFGDREESVPTD